ncbi:MAG: putative quinol monooxygenase [Planctomycetota bacterium]
MIHVIANIEVKPGQRDAFLAIFKRNVPNVLAEDGCLAYGPTVDVETGLPPQVGPRADMVTVVEQWESLEHLRRHLEAPHMKAYKAETRDMVSGVSLQVTEPA